MADGKVGPVSKKIIECVWANPGIHAAEIARVLGISQGGGMRGTVRTLISDGYLSRIEVEGVPHGVFHTALPLKYTGKPFEGFNEGGISKRSQQIQERIAAQIEREKRLAESAAWAGKAIRAMVDAGRAAA
ncbi:TPA: winged helix-turn-helix domain-containing protein [Burkholderia cenocepacia]|uniref:winged helix-turn-helix domain-containing protein n=1 Tax=Burkholderia cenocepacia TaxID=95486 RepID=UPI001BA15F43|nr:winged helix-turn-helix domain-containing protein [Burkholderia cenocepacia]MBR8401951.1 winged helix-turn-helix domain-containing protein [Burkholderia cenocepacia]HEM7896993.1 winged helix-turn-helix domain-containing protein [Burkholderia cenocepacia]